MSDLLLCLLLNASKAVLVVLASSLLRDGVLLTLSVTIVSITFVSLFRRELCADILRYRITIGWFEEYITDGKVVQY